MLLVTGNGKFIYNALHRTYMQKTHYEYPNGLKLCRKCGCLVPVVEFLTDSYKKEKKVGYCKSCRSKLIAEKALGGNRIKALEKTNGRCSVCGSKSGIVVHHVLPRTRGGNDDLENLIPLCRKCHLKAHNGKYTDFLTYEQIMELSVKNAKVM